MAVEWFVDDGSGVLTHADDERLSLIGYYAPDFVKSPPETPEIGARLFRVLNVFSSPCPKCRSTQSVKHFQLEDRYYVARCVSNCGFVWYRMRELK